MQRFCALIMAAGSSSRMGGKPKQFIEIENKSVLLRSLEAFEKCELVDKIIVVTKQEYFDEIKKQAKAGNITKLAFTVQGGNSRMDSVKAGMQYVGDSQYVLVHDCARPLATDRIIRDVASAALEYGAAICGVAVKDTIKSIDDNNIIESTLDRTRLISVQTPQGFKTDILRDALCKADKLDSFTDDASVVEAAGHSVKVVEGDYKNIKITTDEDVATATSFLKEKKRMRIGHGYDVHKFSKDRKLILGGVEIEYEQGLLGHSDADVLIHSVCDALLGAAALGDIGKHFPDNDDKYKNIDSTILLKQVAALLKSKGYGISNIDVTVIAQAPKLAGYIEKMRERVAQCCEVELEKISIKATTEEGLGFTGAKQGIAVHSVCIIE